MKVDSDRLRTIRQRKKLSRPDLERVSGITVRTIQRLENDPDECKSTREDTVMRLAKALEVEPGVFTGELPLPELDEAPASEPDPVRIGAQIAPKVRLAYDLIKRRYGVNATDVITMAPLLFTLLAEGSLKWRREALQETLAAISRLESLGRHFVQAVVVAEMATNPEGDSIDKADIFGENLLSDEAIDDTGGHEPFNSLEDNPFAGYLRRLASDLDVPSIVNVDNGVLDPGSNFRYPYYGICDDELDSITDGSPIGRAGLEMEILRLSEIPEELMPEDKNEDRQKWLEDRMSEKLNGMNMEDLGRFFRKFAHHSLVSPRTKKMLDEKGSRTKTDESENQGDVQ